jgi:hypothetical protein
MLKSILVFWLAASIIRAMMEAASTSETSVNFSQSDDGGRKHL